MALFALAGTVNALAFERLLDPFSGKDFLLLDHSDRVTVIRDLCHSLEANYAGVGLKKARIGLDLRQHCRSAVAKEPGDLKRPTSFQAARANLGFFDRIDRFVGAFQDGHLRIRAAIPRATLKLPLAAIEADGRIVVGRVYPYLLDHFSREWNQPELKSIPVGAEIMTWDGLPVKRAIRALEPYLNASSGAARFSAAVDALTQRSSRWPVRDRVKVGLRYPGETSLREVELPWLHAEISRADEAVFAGAVGYPSFSDLRDQYDEEEEEGKKPLRWMDGYREMESLSGLKEVQGFVNDVEDPVFTSGYLERDGTLLGVIQIHTFNEEKVVEAESDDPRSLGFIEAFREQLLRFKKAAVPVVLDLRVNGGGNPLFVSDIVAMLAPAGVTYPGSTRAYRLTRLTRQLLADRETDLTEISNAVARDAVLDAVAARRAYTDGFSIGDIESDTEVGGIDSPVIAWTGPDCASACEILVSHLLDTHRATVLGRPTHGTGMGFRWQGALNESWKDRFGILTGSIPNTLFGRPRGLLGEKRTPFSWDLSSENQPSRPDVVYERSLKDVLQGDAGWVDKTLDLLRARGR